MEYTTHVFIIRFDPLSRVSLGIKGTQVTLTLDWSYIVWTKVRNMGP